MHKIINRTFCILLACLSAELEASYVGSEPCAECHQSAYDSWRQSHHWQAMQEASEETVLGDFNDQTFTHFGVVSKFYKKDDIFYVKTDNAAGESEEFRISYTFGFYPLQQYLIGFDDGRYQALSIAWDSRPASEGGQRWFHLYPDEAIPHDDPLHWTGAFQNWNSRCASCHSTDLVKNYEQESDSYQTEWAEITVGCESCHGEADKHLTWARGDKSTDDKGFPVSLSPTAQWQLDQGHTKQGQKGSNADSHPQLAVCGSCHSRREELAHANVEKAYLDLYSPSLLLEGLYYPDGQIQDEVYVYGSFLQSKMHAAGVVCSNCHEPHGIKLKKEGNALCSQCHSAAHFDDTAHHHHPEGSSGAQCVNCHMPETSYMVVDPRRDHSFRVPQPILGDLLNTPNACTGCHQDKDNSWANEALQSWLGHQPLKDRHASTFAVARSNSPTALEPLIKIAKDESQPAILRATAVQESGRFPSTQSITNAVEQLYSDDGLVRIAAVRALEAMPPDQRYTLLQPLIEDPLKAVRMAVANALSGVNLDTLKSSQQKQLSALFAEYLSSQQRNADMPSAQANMAIFYGNRGDLKAAEKAYRHALKLSPAYLPAMLNLADLYRSTGQDEKAKPLLEDAIAIAPDQAAAYHAMGLLLVRQKKIPESLDYLEKAAQLAPEVARYSYVYGVALHSSGKPSEAVTYLIEAARQHPGNAQIRSALEAYQKTGARH